MRTSLVLALLLGGCFQMATVEPTQATNDASVELDATMAVPDAGDACECSSGECCDGCHFAARLTLCGPELFSHTTCDTTPSVTQVSTRHFRGQCSGASPLCGPNLGTATTTITVCDAPCDRLADEPVCP